MNKRTERVQRLGESHLPRPLDTTRCHGTQRSRVIIKSPRLVPSVIMLEWKVLSFSPPSVIISKRVISMFPNIAATESRQNGFSTTAAATIIIAYRKAHCVYAPKSFSSKQPFGSVNFDVRLRS